MADDGGEPDEFLYKVLVVGEVRAVAIARGGRAWAGAHTGRVALSGRNVAFEGGGRPVPAQGVAALRLLLRYRVANRWWCYRWWRRWALGRPVWCGSTCTRPSPTTTSPPLVRSDPRLDLASTPRIRRLVRWPCAGGSGRRRCAGVDFALKLIRWDDHTQVRLQLWDIAGNFPTFPPAGLTSGSVVLTGCVPVLPVRPQVRNASAT